MFNNELLGSNEPSQNGWIGKSILGLIVGEGLVTVGIVTAACANKDFVNAAETLIGGTATMAGTGLAYPYILDTLNSKAS